MRCILIATGYQRVVPPSTTRCTSSKADAKSFSDALACTHVLYAYARSATTECTGAWQLAGIIPRLLSRFLGLCYNAIVGILGVCNIHGRMVTTRHASGRLRSPPSIEVVLEDSRVAVKGLWRCNRLLQPPALMLFCKTSGIALGVLVAGQHRESHNASFFLNKGEARRNSLITH